MLKKVSFKNSKGQKLVGVLHYPSRKSPFPGVIVCHGFKGDKDKNFIPKLSQALAQAGILALRFDFSGNGESEGKFEDITYTQQLEDLKAGVRLLIKKGIKRIGIVGHNLGGALGVLIMAQNKQISALVTLAPVVFPVKTHLRAFSHLERVFLAKRKYVIFEDQGRPGRFLRIKKKFHDNAKKFNITQAASKIRRPVLIIGGTKDERIFLKEIKELYRVVPSEVKELSIIKKANHVFEDKRSKQKMIKLTINWFKKYLARESKTVTSFLQYQDKILILKRSSELFLYPNHWNGISGFVGSKESFKKRALIEIEEETGIKAQDLELTKEGQPYRIVDKKIDKVWFSHPLLFKTKTRKIKLDWEHQAYKWIKPQELKKFKRVPHLEKCLA